MTTSQQTWPLAGRTNRIAPMVGTGLLAAALVIGGLAVTRQAASQQSIAAPTFDAVRFRAEEHWAMAPFDAVKFRAEEHAAFPVQAPFDAVAFRAEEHAAMTPLEPYRDTLYQALRRTKNATFAGGGGRGTYAQ